MGKFDKFKVSSEEEQLEEAREAYYQLVSSAPKPGPIDRATELWLRSVIMRSAWLRSKLRSSVVQRARIARGQYECACCKGVFKSQEIEVDHGYQRVGFDGDVSLKDFIDNTFCDPKYLFAVCKPCHRARTTRDRAKVKKQ